MTLRLQTGESIDRLLDEQNVARRVADFMDERAAELSEGSDLRALALREARTWSRIAGRRHVRVLGPIEPRGQKRAA